MKRKTAEEIGLQSLANLRAQAMRNQREANGLRDQIRAVLARNAHLTKFSARAVRAHLRIEPPPSLRTVQEHLKIIRAASSVSRALSMQDDAHGN